MTRQIDAVFKIRWDMAGAHVHCSLFAAPRPDQTYAKCGDFCIREEEFVALQKAMSKVVFEQKEGHR